MLPEPPARGSGNRFQNQIWRVAVRAMPKEFNRPSDSPIAASDEDSRPLPSSRRERHLQQALEQIQVALHGMRFGQVTATVQDGVVVQIDRLERTRLQRI